MIWLANICAEGAVRVYLRLGVVLCYVPLWFKERQAGPGGNPMESGTNYVLDKAKRDADAIIRDARLIANEESLKIRDQNEQYLPARRRKRGESERRFERAGNLDQCPAGEGREVENSMREQKEAMQKKAEALLDGMERQTLDNRTERRETIAGIVGLTQAKDRAPTVLRAIEQEIQKL